MILLLSALGLLLVAAIAVTWAALAEAPEGMEDATGFHAVRGAAGPAGSETAEPAVAGEAALPPMLAGRYQSGSWL